MVKYVYLKFWTFVLGLLAMPVSPEKSYASDLISSESVHSMSNDTNLLFTEPYLDDTTSFQVAGHRSHRSHSSHRSHYSSRVGYGSYHKPSYSSPSKSSSSYSSPSNRTKSVSVSSDNVSKTSIDSETKVDPVVLEIQEKLKKLGFYEGEVDGLYGEKTRNAIILYQTKEGLDPDGKATKDLLEQINEHYF